MLIVLLLIASGILLTLLMTLAMNLLIFPKLRATDQPAETPKVSILIPARDEAEVIGNTVRHILGQTYSNFEFLLLDDQSSDGTGEIARQAAGDDSRLTVISGEPLPDGWMGKSWACHTLAQHATGDILIFTDADVIWKPNALESILAQMEQSKAGMVTVWPTQITESMAERLTVPTIMMVILGYLPVVMVHHSPLALFSAANGQLMAWRRDVYEAIGGHTIVANNVLDDLMLARATKKHGYRIWMADGNGQIFTRMYTDWRSVRDGFAKNIFAAYGGIIPMLVVGFGMHWLIFMVPYVALFFPQYRVWGVSLIILGLSLRLIPAIFTRQRMLDAFLMPVTVILFSIISVQSLYWEYTGGPMWKGRKLGKDTT